jgi:hypothetical protein
VITWGTGRAIHREDPNKDKQHQIGNQTRTVLRRLIDGVQLRSDNLQVGQPTNVKGRGESYIARAHAYEDDARVDFLLRIARRVDSLPGIYQWRDSCKTRYLHPVSHSVGPNVKYDDWFRVSLQGNTRTKVHPSALWEQ